MLTPLEKINFVASHKKLEYYESDLKLFKKLYPASPLIKDFENAEAYSKPEYQERILLTILDDVCPDTVWEFRGKAVQKDKLIDLDNVKSKENAEEYLKQMDLGNDFNYNHGVSIATVLELELEDKRKDTVLNALKEYRESLQEPAAPATDKYADEEGEGEGEENNQDTNDPEVTQAKETDTKKKEGQD